MMIRHTGGRFQQLAQRIAEGEVGERRIPTSWRLKESVFLSLESFSEALGVTKSDIVNEVLETGLNELGDVLRNTRPDLCEIVEGGPCEEWKFNTPAECKHIREALPPSAEIVLQTDLEDAISEAQNNQSETEDSE